MEEEYNPTPVEDESGRSASSEGDIANHHPFNAVADVVRPDPESEAEEMKASPSRKKKTIIYSDKSESSIDELMGDTPSNYNIPNGRLDGKSLGLKVFLLN